MYIPVYTKSEFVTRNVPIGIHEINFLLQNFLC